MHKGELLSIIIMPPEHTTRFWKAAIESYGGPWNIPDMFLVMINVATPDAAGNGLQRLEPDLLRKFGLEHKLSVPVIVFFVQYMRLDFAHKKPEDYNYEDLIAIRHILCKSYTYCPELVFLMPSAYKKAAAGMAKLARWPEAVSTGMTNLSILTHDVGGDAANELMQEIASSMRPIPPGLSRLMTALLRERG